VVVVPLGVVITKAEFMKLIPKHLFQSCTTPVSRRHIILPPLMLSVCVSLPLLNVYPACLFSFAIPAARPIVHDTPMATLGNCKMAYPPCCSFGRPAKGCQIFEIILLASGVTAPQPQPHVIDHSCQ
jgi:hypothetical protein